MSRVQVLGGWYGDCVLTGQWAALVRDSHIETSAGRVDLPAGQNVLFLRMAMRERRMYLAGQGHRDGAAWLWDGVTWRSVSAQTNGQKVVAFGPLGLYVALDGLRIGAYNLDTSLLTRILPIPTGSGGIQYVQDNGVVETGDMTYSGDVAEWTRLGDLIVGQSYQSGAVCVRGADRRELEPGDCRFIHAYRSGDQLAVSMVTPGAFVAHWLDVADLATLPREAGSAPEPVLPVPNPHNPAPTPPIRPVPTPEPNMSIPNRFDIIQRIDREFPRLVQQNTPETVREFYWRAGYALHQADPRFGWLSKTPPENGHEVAGQFVSLDAFAYQGSDEVVDTLTSAGDGPGTGGIGWGMKPRRPSNVWIQPVPFPGSAPGPTPPPTQTHRYDGGENDTGTCDKCGQPRASQVHAVTDDPQPMPAGCNCKDEIAVLAAQLAALRSDLQDTTQTASFARREAIDARAIAERVTSKPWPKLKLVADQTAEPISTNKTGWPGHAHQLRVRPVPEPVPE